jgi:hypothetical protein
MSKGAEIRHSGAIRGEERALAIHKKAGRAAHKLAKRVRLSVWGCFCVCQPEYHVLCGGGLVGLSFSLSLVIFHECMHPGSLCVIDRLCAKSVQAVAAAATATARMARGGSRRQIIQLHTHTHTYTQFARRAQLSFWTATCMAQQHLPASSPRRTGRLSPPLSNLCGFFAANAHQTMHTRAKF